MILLLHNTQTRIHDITNLFTECRQRSKVARHVSCPSLSGNAVTIHSVHHRLNSTVHRLIGKARCHYKRHLSVPVFCTNRINVIKEVVHKGPNQFQPLTVRTKPTNIHPVTIISLNSTGFPTQLITGSLSTSVSIAITTTTTLEPQLLSFVDQSSAQVHTSTDLSTQFIKLYFGRRKTTRNHNRRNLFLSKIFVTTGKNNFTIVIHEQRDGATLTKRCHCTSKGPGEKNVHLHPRMMIQKIVKSSDVITI